AVAVPVREGVGRGGGHIRAPRALGHPLPGCPKVLWIARGQVLEDGARDVIRVELEQSRGAIGHRQGAAVGRRRWCVGVEAYELVDARERAVAAFIPDGD